MGDGHYRHSLAAPRVARGVHSLGIGELGLDARLCRLLVLLHGSFGQWRSSRRREGGSAPTLTGARAGISTIRTGNASDRTRRSKGMATLNTGMPLLVRPSGAP